MGAAESSDIEECSPPLPTHSTLFVVRNGRYEPQDWQNLMPSRVAADGVDFDGFAERDTRHGRRVARPPEIRQAPLLQNPVSVRRDSFATLFSAPRAQAWEAKSAERSWSAWSCGEDEVKAIAAGSQRANPSDIMTSSSEKSSAVLSFTFDAVDAVKVSVHLLAREVEELDSRGVTSNVWLAPQQDQLGSLVDICGFEAGLGQVYRSPPLCLSNWSHALAYDDQRPKHVPVAIKLEVAGKDGSPPNKQYTYVSLHVNEGTPGAAPDQPWAVQVYTQKLQYGEQVFVLHELFGVSSALTDEVESEVGSGECIICLAEPRDTAVLPCRHMCFCSHCAGVARLQCERCPVCRQKVSSLLQLKRKKEAPLKAVASQLDSTTV